MQRRIGAKITVLTAVLAVLGASAVTLWLWAVGRLGRGGLVGRFHDKG